MQTEKDGAGIIVTEIQDFNLAQTLECGQCFHFEKTGEMEYAVVHQKRLLHIKQEGNRLFCRNTTTDEFETVWRDYFDLDRDYDRIKRCLVQSDKRLEDAVHTNYGMRILNQQFEETLMSFIISQNKQIPHIKKIVREISEKYGDYLGTINDMEFYAFPDREQLKRISVEDYRACKAGFRAPYLFDASEKLSESGFDMTELKNAGYEKAKEKLLTIKGVGEKVANCVLLFSLGYRNAFPVDVWIKRIMEQMYFGKSTGNQEIVQFAKKRFGEYGGYAQQYLFYYERNKQLEK